MCIPQAGGGKGGARRDRTGKTAQYGTVTEHASAAEPQLDRHTVRRRTHDAQPHLLYRRSLCTLFPDATTDVQTPQRQRHRGGCPLGARPWETQERHGRSGIFNDGNGVKTRHVGNGWVTRRGTQPCTPYGG